MENIRNKIITISGEPASGKSTVVKEIKSKYEKQGFNVYIISVGDVFRLTKKKDQTMFILLIHDLHGVMYQIHMQSD